MAISKQKIILESEIIPRVDLDFMNNTHFEEIEMVKELGELVNLLQANENQQNKNTLAQKLNAWLNHTILHFERENTLMQDTGFPAYAIHSHEHEIALKQMKDIVSAWEKNHDIGLVADYIFDTWPTWFNQHVNTMDMMTAKFAVMNGYTNH